MLSNMKPFRLCGNIYFVGCKEYSCHLIDTGEGLIMLDNGLEKNAPAVVESMGMLGFKPEDVKILLISHEHGDHYYATQGIFGDNIPPIYVNERAKLKMGLTPAVLLKDGDVIRLGNTEILCRYTPGHTIDVMSFFFNVEEGGKTYRAGMFGGTGITQMSKKFLEERGLSETQKDMFFESVEKLRPEHVDVVLGNHCDNNHTLEKYEASLTSEKNPFINETGSDWTWLLNLRKAQLEELIRIEKVTDFLKEAGYYFLATEEGDQPRVRPFGTADIYRNHLYIQTGKPKNVTAQLLKNPKTEICAYKDGRWVRIAATLTEVDDLKAQKSMLDAYPELRGRYSEGDGVNTLFRVDKATATFYSFTDEPETLCWD